MNYSGNQTGSPDFPSILVRGTNEYIFSLCQKSLTNFVLCFEVSTVDQLISWRLISVCSDDLDVVVSVVLTEDNYQQVVLLSTAHNLLVMYIISKHTYRRFTSK